MKVLSLTFDFRVRALDGRVKEQLRTYTLIHSHGAEGGGQRHREGGEGERTQKIA